MVFLAATAAFARQNIIKNKVYAVISAFVVH